MYVISMHSAHVFSSGDTPSFRMYVDDIQSALQRHSDNRPQVLVRRHHCDPSFIGASIEEYVGRQHRVDELLLTAPDDERSRYLAILLRTAPIDEEFVSGAERAAIDVSAAGRRGVYEYYSSRGDLRSERIP